MTGDGPGAYGEPGIQAAVRPGMEAAAASQRTLIALDAVSIVYRRRSGQPPLVAVKEVSFSISEGEIVAVVGPSGCGKSSLLMAIAGLVPVAGGNIQVARPREHVSAAVDVGVVFQQASLLPWRSIEKNVALGLEVRGLKKEERLKLATSVLELVGLKEFARSYPHELSGGMQQRANLARALVVDPPVLLFDEPFAALDAQTREEMQEELLRIWGVSRKAGLFITHQIDEALFVADRVVVMSKGPASVVKEELEVPFGRPRSLTIKRTPRFQEMVSEVWDAMRT